MTLSFSFKLFWCNSSYYSNCPSAQQLAAARSPPNSSDDLCIFFSIYSSSMLQVMLQTYIHILEMEEDRAQEEEGLATSKERKERRRKAQVNEQKKIQEIYILQKTCTVYTGHLITGNIWLDSLRLISCLFPLSSFTMEDAEPIFSNLRKFVFFF